MALCLLVLVALVGAQKGGGAKAMRGRGQGSKRGGSRGSASNRNTGGDMVRPLPALLLQASGLSNNGLAGQGGRPCIGICFLRWEGRGH